MSLRTFVFCDICNPQGYRCVEERRPLKRANRNGRRISDGRAWHEGDVTTALAEGWAITKEGLHVCPDCLELHQSLFVSGAAEPLIEEIRTPGQMPDQSIKVHPDQQK